jgi:hypothetical protein
VNYGTSTSYGSTGPYNATYVTSHSVTLTGLSSLTTYHFDVVSNDGIASTSPDYTFTTASAGLPTATNATTTGVTAIGNTLTGHYSFFDPNGKSDSSTYQWVESSASGGTYASISGATSTTYALVASDIGQYLRFQVTPVSLSGTGTMQQSTPTSQIQSAAPPTASLVTITGTSTEGDTLTGSYTYFQTNGVASSTPLYQWFEASSSGGSYTAIASATAKTYSLGPSDVTQYLKLQVTPVAVYPPTTGAAATSSYFGPINPSSFPVASNITITGTFVIGQTLQGSYTYSDSGGHPSSTPLYHWLEATASNGTYTNISANSTSSSYTIVASDVGNYIELGVTPVSTVATGTEAFNNPPNPEVQNSGPPTAPSVTILGTATEGDTLTGTSTYADPNNFAQGSSTYHWLEATSSNGTYASITGATNLTYTLQSSDVGNYLEFRVIPVSVAPPTTGTSTYSTSVGPILPDSYPVASTPAISGSLNVGSLLTGSYAYSDAGSHAQASSTFQWFESPTISGTYASIPGATASTYILQSSDLSDYLEFRVTPVSTVAQGSATTSASVGPVVAPLTYYVAPSSGSNANSGQSSSTSWATLAYLVSNTNVVVPQAGSAVTSTTAITMSHAVSITPTAGTTIMIPASTTFTTASTTDFTQLMATSSVSSANLPANDTLEGSVAFGLTSSPISLSQAITISIPVSSSYNGTALPVYQSEDGGNTWTELTTCTIASGVCSFTTSNLSSFAVVLPTSSETSSPPAGVPVSYGVGGGGSAYDISINGGAATTQTPNVTLSLYGTGAYMMALSNTPSFASSTWAPYEPSVPWTLPSSTGEVTVYVEFQSVSGGIVGSAQASIDLNPSSVPPSLSTSGMTVSQMESLLASLESELQALEAKTGSETSSAASAFTFTRNLSYGMTGTDVHQLQLFLIQENVGSAARKLAAQGTTQYFGSLTKAALVELQKSVGIVPDSGYFGPISRAYVTSRD